MEINFCFIPNEKSIENYVGQAFVQEWKGYIYTFFFWVKFSFLIINFEVPPSPLKSKISS